MRSFQNRFRSAFKSLHDSIRSKPRRRLSQFDCSRSLAAEFLEDRCLLAAGAFDTSFAGIGQKTVAFDRGGSLSDVGEAIAIQSDGKILVAGAVQVSSSDTDFGVTRLKSDGSIDTTFGTNGKVTIAFDFVTNGFDKATAIAVQADGKIVVVGQASFGDSARRTFALARLTSAGRLDTTFSDDGKALIHFGSDSSATGVAIQSNGKIVVSGTEYKDFSGKDMAVARFNSNGTLDTTFNGVGFRTVAFDIGGSKEEYCNAISLQADGKIVLAGTAHTGGSNVFEFAVARLTTSGSLDTTFDGDGKKTIAFDHGVASAVAVSSSGKIVVAGRANVASDQDFAVARLNSNGSLDSTFDGDGKKTIAFDLGGSNNDQANAVKIQSDGKIVVAGSARVSFGVSDFAVARLNSNGSLDTSFDGDGKRRSSLSGDDEARGMALQSNGRIVLAGYSNAVGDNDFGIIRLLNS